MPASLCDSIIISDEKEVVKGIVKEYQNFFKPFFFDPERTESGFV